MTYPLAVPLAMHLKWHHKITKMTLFGNIENIGLKMLLIVFFLSLCKSGWEHNYIVSLNGTNLI